MRDLPGPGIEPVSPCIGRWILNHCTTREVPKWFISNEWNVAEVMVCVFVINNKRHCGFCLVLGSLALGEGNCHVVRTFKQPCGEELRPPASSLVSEPSQKHTDKHGYDWAPSSSPRPTLAQNSTAAS